MAKNTIYITSLVLALFTTTLSAHAQNSTPDYWKCDNKVGGSWEFGRGPDGCDLRTFQNPSFVKREFRNVIFDDSKNWDDERERYMQEMYALLRDLGKAYIKRRKPDVESDEMRAWMRAVFATAHQESFWTHYRKVNSPELKMMRGDYGHGHGMMQVDDRWHFAAINKGQGANLIENITYSLDEYFAAWEKAPEQKCVDSPTEWRQRARSAYSAYNGGPSKICRWTNPNDRWARNDKNWIEKFDSERWYSYVANRNYRSPVDVECHLNGGTNCFHVPGNIPLGDLYGYLLKHSKGYSCVIDNNTFHCLASSYHSACLVAYYDVEPEAVQLKPDDEKVFPVVLHDPLEFCEQSIPGLILTGDILHLNKDINIRKTPAGQLVGLAAKGTISEVFEFVVESEGSFKRYYKINAKGDVGYIYAGESNNHASWAERISDERARGQVPQIGDQVKIVNAPGINLRQGIGGKVIGMVPYDKIVGVEDRTFKEKSGKLYLSVSYGGKKGVIYAGEMDPYSVDKWVEKVAEVQQLGTLANNISFAFPRTCPSNHCPMTGDIIGDARAESEFSRDRQFMLLEVEKDWVKIQKNVAQQAGWIQSIMVDEI